MRYRWRTTPYAHQARAVAFCVDQFRRGRQAALLMEPRTGKTKTTIDVIGVLWAAKKIRKVVIVCPARVMGVWVQEIHAHAPYLSLVTVWDAEARQHPIMTDREQRLHIVVVNYEAFSHGGSDPKKGRLKHRNTLLKWLGKDPSLCVLDESHKIKSPSSKAARLLVGISPRFTYRMLLTGTPVTKANRVHDVYMQWKFLDPTVFAAWPTAESFRSHTGKWVAVGAIKLWKGPRDEGIAVVRERIGRDSVIVRREDCFDLPKKSERVIPITLTDSAPHYDDMARTMVTQIREGLIAEASIPLVVCTRLSQITGGFVTAMNEETRQTAPVRVGTEKLDALRVLFEEEVQEREEKIVVAARFRFDLDAIHSLASKLKLPVYAVRGGTQRIETDEAIVRFRDHDGAAVMLIQPSAASLGIDLSSASHMVWYGLTSSWVDYTQACDRIALSKKPITHTYLTVPDSIDTVLHETLTTDGQVARAVLRDPERLLRA